MASQPSLLDDLGEEVTGIVAPVSLCMAVTVLLVRLLNPDGVSSSSTMAIASIAYSEDSSDSSGKKFGGALLNALIFVGVIAVMTVILFLLFKYKCYKFIYAYMGFAVFNIFFFITGALFIQVMQVINLHIDAFSFAYGLYNFSVVGTLGLLWVPIPLLSKQIYLIWVGIIVAYIFTFIPEWTAWVLLVFMALYDIAAVLIPGGPLKALVELAIERKQDLPALIYEARPAGGRPYVRGWGNRGGGAAAGDGGASRAVAEGSGTAPPPLEMRRPESCSQFPSSAPLAVTPAGGGAAGGSVPTRRPGSGGAWTTEQPSSGSGMGGTPTRSSQRPAVGDAEGGTQSKTPPAAADSLRSFEDGTALWQQNQQTPQPRRLGTASGAAGSGGPWPVAEGREESEWQPLAASSAAEPQAAGPGTGFRSRLASVLSAGSGRAGGGDCETGRSTPASHTSQEPLIDARSLTPSPVQERERNPGMHPAPSPTFPGAVASTAPGGGFGAVGRGGSSVPGSVGPPDLAASAGSGRVGSPRASTTSNLGVRAVAPAIGTEQLVEAVRRSRPASAVEGVHVSVGGGAAAQMSAVGVGPGAPRGGPPSHHSDEGVEVDLPDSIKLGLGDFIFYSMLVGRAAMYDFMTVFSSYLAIIAGLGLTLLCLAIFQKALPALPFSIALGVAFYFVTRFTLEPFLVPLSVNLAYF